MQIVVEIRVGQDSLGLPKLMLVASAGGKIIEKEYSGAMPIESLFMEFKGVDVTSERMPVPMPQGTAGNLHTKTLSEEFGSNQVRDSYLSVIEREDIVMCVKLLPRDIDNNTEEDLQLGKEFRVIDIYKKDGKVFYYEVVNDDAPTRYRIPAFPEEIELRRKRGPKEAKREVFTTIKNCPECGTENGLEKIQGVYAGFCTKCGLPIEVASA